MCANRTATSRAMPTKHRDEPCAADNTHCPHIALPCVNATQRAYARAFERRSVPRQFLQRRHGPLGTFAFVSHRLPATAIHIPPSTLFTTPKSPSPQHSTGSTPPLPSLSPSPRSRRRKLLIHPNKLRLARSSEFHNPNVNSHTSAPAPIPHSPAPSRAGHLAPKKINSYFTRTSTLGHSHAPSRTALPVPTIT